MKITPNAPKNGSGFVQMITMAKIPIRRQIWVNGHYTSHSSNSDINVCFNANNRWMTHDFRSKGFIAKPQNWHFEYAFTLNTEAKLRFAAKNRPGYFRNSKNTCTFVTFRCALFCLYHTCTILHKPQHMRSSRPRDGVIVPLALSHPVSQKLISYSGSSAKL